MGAPTEYNYPNQMAQQYPTEQMQVAKKAFVEQPVAHDKFHKVMDTIGDAIGWGWVFGLFVLGGVIALIVIFKKQVKNRFGDFIKILNNLVNK